HLKIFERSARECCSGQADHPGREIRRARRTFDARFVARTGAAPSSGICPDARAVAARSAHPAGCIRNLKGARSFAGKYGSTAVLAVGRADLHCKQGVAVYKPPNQKRRRFVNRRSLKGPARTILPSAAKLQMVLTL